MFKFACRDLGPVCDFEARAEERCEVMQMAMMHVITAHANRTCCFTEEESVEFLQSLEAVVQLEEERVLA